MDLVRTQVALFKVIEQTTGDIMGALSERWTFWQIVSLLKLLEKYWSQFLSNHVDLLRTEDENALDADYFIDDYYKSCQKCYTQAQSQL